MGCGALGWVWHFSVCLFADLRRLFFFFPEIMNCIYPAGWLYHFLFCFPSFCLLSSLVCSSSFLVYILSIFFLQPEPQFVLVGYHTSSSSYVSVIHPSSISFLHPLTTNSELFYDMYVTVLPFFSLSSFLCL